MNQDVEKFKASLSRGQLLEQLLGSIPEVYYFVKDLNGRFISASESFAKLMGQQEVAGVLGKTDYDVAPAFLADHFREDDRSVLNTGEPIIDKIELVPAADGSLDWLTTTKVPLWNDAKEVVGIAGVARLIVDSDEVYFHNPQMKFIVHFLRDHYMEKISMAEVAKKAGVSVSKQERLFKKLFSITPLMYLQKIRLNAACSLLRNSNTEIVKIATKTGFKDQTNMTRAFRMELNITPLKYRKKFSVAVKDRPKETFFQ